MKKKYITATITMSDTTSPKEKICFEVVSGDLEFSGDEQEGS